MSDTFTFKIQGDGDGFVTFECPFCSSEFKLQAGEVQSDEEPVEELFCPYCGLTKGRDDFLADEVIEQVETIMQNYLAEMLNEAFGEMSRSVNSSMGGLTMTYKPLEKVSIKELKNKDTVETEFKCDCCNRSVKVLYCASVSKIFCPYCGVDI